MDGALVIAGRDASEMLEFIEDAFDPIAQFVGDRVKLDEKSAGSVGRDDGIDEFAGRVGTIGYHVLTSLGRRYSRRYVGRRFESSRDKAGGQASRKIIRRRTAARA
jgi:hypothetical protein